MKRNYYYLVAGLQDITLDIHKLSLSRSEFIDELKNELHPDDYAKAEILVYRIDNDNLVNLLAKNDKEFLSGGVFSREEMEESIKEPSGILPGYMVRFIDAVKNDEEIISGMSKENQLTALFYGFTQNLPDGFLKDWFRFNRDINNILTALVCRKYDIPYDNQIIGADETSEAIRKSPARDFGLSAEISIMDDLMNIAKNDDVQEKEKAIDQLRWNYLDDVTFFEYFTIDKVLAFLLKIEMVERWLSIDKEHGNDLFMDLLQELKSSYKLPESFTEK